MAYHQHHFWRQLVAKLDCQPKLDKSLALSVDEAVVDQSVVFLRQLVAEIRCWLKICKFRIRTLTTPMK
jgi:hypothetical protein